MGRSVGGQNKTVHSLEGAFQTTPSVYVGVGGDYGSCVRTNGVAVDDRAPSGDSD